MDTTLTLWDFIIILAIVQIPVWAPVLREIFTVPNYDHREEREEYRQAQGGRRRKHKGK